MAKRRCKKCGGKIKINLEKIMLVVGGGAALMAVGMALGVPTGTLAVLGAFASGTLPKSNFYPLIVRAKVALAEESDRLGSYAKCRDCCRDISVSELFD